MAGTLPKVWTAEVLFASDLNAQFDYLIDNALTVISPLTGNLDCGSNLLLNIGAAGTDFTSGGGLTLADVLVLSNSDSRTSTVSRPITITETTSGSPAAGIGTGLVVQAESADENPAQLGQIDFIFTNVGAGAEESDMLVNLRTGGNAPVEKFRVTSDGGVTPAGSAPATPDAKTLYEDSIIKAWVNSDTGSTINDDLNVTGITTVTTGQMVATFATAMSTANYVAIGSALEAAGNTLLGAKIASMATGSCTMETVDQTPARVDPSAGFLLIVIGNN